MPAKYADRAPHIVERDDGSEAWVYEGQELPNVGFNAVVGRPVERVQLRTDALRRDAARRVGHRRPHRRHGPQRCVRVAVLPVVPSGVRRPAAPAAHRRSRPRARRRVRAWNDWVLEDWVGYAPGRMIPLQLPYLLDPEVAADEVRRNAERGFTAMTFSEAPAHARAAVAAQRPLGSADGGVRGDRDRRVPARRVVRARHRRRRPTRPPTPSACCSSGTRCSPPSTGSTRASRCGSPTSRSA